MENSVVGDLYTSIPQRALAIQWTGNNLDQLEQFIAQPAVCENTRQRWESTKLDKKISPDGTLSFGIWYAKPGYWFQVTRLGQIKILTDHYFRRLYVVPPPVILTLTGMSCSGKSSIEKVLAESYGYGRVISTTTRAPRPGEVQGREYYFVERTEFVRRNDAGEFVESLEFAGQFYGVTQAEVQRVLACHRNIVIVCEPYGATQVASYCAQHGLRHRPVCLKPDLERVWPRLQLRFGEPENNVRMQNAVQVESLWPEPWDTVAWELLECGDHTPEELAAFIHQTKE